MVLIFPAKKNLSEPRSNSLIGGFSDTTTRKQKKKGKEDKKDQQKEKDRHKKKRRKRVREREICQEIVVSNAG